ncbi:hypothetical protein MPSEU_000134500 [Mayamaea pseudoterrestris]|nr:hypothetical protein MPSEU_000134500 [Mayamaea pseudoterrestris]
MKVSRRLMVGRATFLLWNAFTSLLLIAISPQPHRGAADAFVSLTAAPSVQKQLRYSCKRQRHIDFALLAAKLTSEEVKARLDDSIARLREKDKKTKLTDPDELKIVFEDDHLVVIDKPVGVLSVPSEPGVPSLIESVFARYQKQQAESPATCKANITHYEPITKMHQMVVHRLGMETSGLIIFAKSLEAVRKLNTLFRTRKITRQYEALVCGHVTSKTHGLINLPLMRDYEYPPYMRISTDEHQRHLLELNVTMVGRKLLRAPLSSLTHFQVLGLENFRNSTDLPVTRLTLTSISGRTHQLNVHCAAYGHAIVHDLVHGFKGEAAPYGGLAFEETISNDRASLELQEQLYEATQGDRMCIHCKLLRFKHPCTKETMELTSPASF